MSHPPGRTLPVPPARWLSADLLALARGVPAVLVYRRVRLAAVRDARRDAADRPSWAAVVARAFGLVAATRPALRRSWVGLPGRPFEHAASVAAVAVEMPGSDGLAFTPVPRPESLALEEIDARLARPAHFPPRLPGALRRLALRFRVAWSGRQRAAWLGTFGVHVHAGGGFVGPAHPLNVLTATVHFATDFAADGSTEVGLTGDARLLPPAALDRCLADLERVLNDEVLTELRYRRRPDAG